MSFESDSKGFDKGEGDQDQRSDPEQDLFPFQLEYRPHRHQEKQNIEAIKN